MRRKMTDDIVKRLRDTTGIHEELLYEAADEIERLRDKCDKQAMILRRLAPEKFPDTLFLANEIRTICQRS
jgi:hypothetical protein